MKTFFIQKQSSEETKEITTVEDLKSAIDDATDKLKSTPCWIFYDQNFVLLGKGCEALHSKISMVLETIRELRLFCSDGELYVWRYKGMLKGRLRLDDDPEGSLKEIYCTEPYTWAALKGEQEYKNISLNVDASLNYEDVQQYLVYNYFKYDPNGDINFYDARLVAFIGKEGA